MGWGWGGTGGIETAASLTFEAQSLLSSSMFSMVT